MGNKLFGNVKDGTSLVETILAIAIVAIVVPALIVLGVVSLRSNKNAERRSEASKLASSAIEAVKYVRDSDGANCGFAAFPYPDSIDHPSYLSLVSSGGTICGIFNVVSFESRATTVIPDVNKPENTYDRIIKLDKYGDSGFSLKVTVTVSWGDNGAGNSVTQSAIINSLTAY